MAFLGGDRVTAFIVLTEDHLPGGGLQDAGDGDIDRLGDHLLGVVHHDNGAIVEIGDALIELLAFLDDEDAHGLAGQHDGLERVGQFVDVQDLDAVQLRDFVEVEIVGDDLAIEHLGQFDELHIDFLDVREVLFHNLHGQQRHLLNPLQDVEAAAAAIAFHGIGRVGHQLQFAEHELRNHQHAIEEAGLRNIGDAAIDDDAGIEYLVGLLGRFFAAEDAAERSQVQQVALLGADDQAHVAHEQQERHLQKRLRCRLAQHKGHEKRTDNTEHAAACRADQPFQADPLQTHFKEDDAEP